MRRLETLIVEYQQRTDSFPSDLRDALPADLSSPERDRAVRDPWGQRYELHLSDSLIRLRSAGPDSMLQTEDDIIHESRRRP
jgi:hypothetical protein